MLILKGVLVGVVRGEKQQTSKGVPFQLLNVLQQDGTRANVVNVKDYSMKDFPLNKAIELQVWVSAWTTKQGEARLSYTREREK